MNLTNLPPPLLPYARAFVVLTVLLLSNISWVVGATVSDTIWSHLQHRYATAEHLHVVMEIQAFTSEDATEPFMEEQAEIKKSANRLFYRYQQQQGLVNPRVNLLIDEQHRVIRCQRPDTAALATSPTLPIAGSHWGALPDSTGIAPQLVDQSDGQLHYRVTMPEGAIEQADVWLDERSLLTQRIVYHYRQGSRVHINFTTMTLSPEFPDDTFSEAPYVVALSEPDRRYWKPTEAYAHYHLLQ